MKLMCSNINPPLGGLIVAEYVRILNKTPLEIVWGDENVFEDINCRTSNDVARAVAKLFCPQLYGSTILEMTEIDHWLTLALGQLNSKHDFSKGIEILNKNLGPKTYLVGKQLTIADFIVFSSLYVNKQWNDLTRSKSAPINTQRWYNYISSQEAVTNILNALSSEIKAALMPSEKSSSKQSLNKSGVGNRAQEGKFVDLPGAEMGKVVVRFPPEASGYLHIGHAKAALLNQYYQESFQGKLVLRFDDTNPAKENLHFEKVILEDVALLHIKPDIFTHTSQYFDLMLEYCEKLLKEGKAYVDDTDAELMKIQREQKVESPNRYNAVEHNFKLWEEMKKGTVKGQECCVRAKIDMQSPNGCMRDPTIYRFKNEPHPRTGTQYKVYPTYDFACPIVDAIEGVTHTLRTMEYHDRDPQFYWFIEALGLRKPYIWEYSRLSMTNTVLSKRKLTWFVNEGLVDGWDDPRMPTVRGVLRRGMTVQGLKEFIIAQGSSRSVVFMEWDKIWAFNKKVIDPIAPRYTAVDYDNHVPILIKGVKEDSLRVPKHPKNADVGTKEIWVGPKILVDRVDAEALKEGENATFINWGNLLIKKINRENGKIVNVEAELNLENKDYKKTLKLTWLADVKKAPFIPTYCVYFDHIISKPLLGKDEDFKQYVGHQTRKEVQMLGDPELEKLKKDDIIQLQRRGFFRVDVPYEALNPFTCKEQPIILFAVPDGHANDNPLNIAETKTTAAVSNKPAKSNVTKSTAVKTPSELNAEIIKQGDIVRKLKEQKVAKGEIDKSVKLLLSLKAEYKSAIGTDWKPDSTVPDLSQNNLLKAFEGDLVDLNNKINAQGDKVRHLKSLKTEKAVIDSEVKTLLLLKAKYKSFTGKDWVPETTVPIIQVDSKETTLDENSILQKITAQGDKVRDLKTKKADKALIDAEVKNLLSLKADYKALSGKDWKPGTSPSVLVGGSGDSQENNLLAQITAQGDRVRQLKTDKAEKTKVDEEVKKLLQLKADFKTLSGKDWKPGMKPEVSSLNNTLDNSAVAAPEDNSVHNLAAKITDQGNLIRDLKAKKAIKQEIDDAVKVLLDLKANYKNLTGSDFPVQGRTPSKPKENKSACTTKEKVLKQKPAPKQEKLTNIDAKESSLKKQTRLGLEAKKEEQLSDWYSQVITKSELIEYYDVSGCYILRPWAYSIWESIRNWFDTEIKKLGIQNCYFPIFVSQAVLEKEKTHIADFAPEVAWVTRSGDSDMAEPVAIRPTSETVMYPAYAKWIQSYRDLPIKLNQWNNVVRWEFKHPQPFLRTREFLWQEGHTAYANKEDADKEVSTILDLYARIYTDLLALPVIKGRKSEKEKFAGGDYTLTIEAFISASGRGIQGGTSHHLGQNFSKMFEIVFEDPDTQEKKYVYQNSFGITTRTIGVMIMVHSDNQGLVLPPRVASIQVIIVPCGVTSKEESQNSLQKSCDILESDLKIAGIRAEGDYRSNYSPGWKFNHWELKGVPIRVELGPKDIEKGQIVAVRRDTSEKISIPRKDAKQKLQELLDDIQKNLYNKALNDLDSHTIVLTDWSKFTPNLDKKNIIMAPFCGDLSCEDAIKANSTRDDAEGTEPGAPSMGAKTLCIPFEQPAAIAPATKCIHPECGRKPLYYALFGRSY